MSRFSDYLQKCIKDQHLTLKEAAEYTKQNYSLLSKYIHGKRLPKNVQAIKDIANGLQLNNTDKIKLIKLYQQEKIGKDDYLAFSEITKLAQQFDMLFSSPKSLFPKPVYKNIKPIEQNITPLYSKQDILDSLAYALIYFSNLEKVHLYAIMQPDDTLNEALINHAISHKIKMQQIVCIDQNSKNSSLNNLITFSKLITLTASSLDEEVAYYYESVHNHVNSFNWMPNFIIIENYTIRFDNTLSYGELITNTEHTDFFKEAFKRRWKRTHRLTAHLNSAKQHTQYLYQKEICIEGFSIHSWPCIGAFLSPDIYEKYLIKDLPQREEIIKLLTMSNNYENKKLPRKPFVSLIDANGLEDFLQNGIIKEFPSAYYTPLETNTCLQIIDRTIESIIDGWYTVYVAKDFFKLPKHMGLVFTSSRISLKNTNSPNIDTYEITDAPLCQLLAKYIAHCIENNYVYSKEESLQLIIEARKRFT